MLFARTWIWLFGGFCIAYAAFPRYFNGDALKCSFFYAAIVFLNFLFGDSYFNSIPTILTELMVIFFCILLSRYLLLYKDEIFVRNTLITIVPVIIITCFFTIEVANIMPGVVREVVVILNQADGESAVLELYRLGVCEYPFPHAIPIIIPPLMLWILNPSKKWLRPFAVLLIGLIFYFLYICDVGTPIFVGVFVLFVSLLMSTKTFKRSLFRLSLVLLISLPFFSRTMMISSLEFVEDSITEENLIKKKRSSGPLQQTSGMDPDLRDEYARKGNK